MRRPVPWRERDVLLTVFLIGTGWLVSLTGWWGASGTASVDRQQPWVSLGLAGTAVGCLGAAYLIAAGRIALRRRHGQVAARLATISAAGPKVGHGDVLVAANRMTRFHRLSCPAVLGKNVSAATVEEHRVAGRQPCDLCRPDRPPGREAA